MVVYTYLGREMPRQEHNPAAVGSHRDIDQGTPRLAASQTRQRVAGGKTKLADTLQGTAAAHPLEVRGQIRSAPPDDPGRNRRGIRILAALGVAQDRHLQHENGA